MKFPCPTKTALLIAYQEATKLYADELVKLAQKIGVSPREEYESLRIIAEKARRLSLKAVEALDAHTHEHGCESKPIEMRTIVDT